MNGLTEPENIALHAENAELLERLKYKEQVIQNLSHSLDREMKTKGRISSVLHDEKIGKMTNGTALSYIRMIMGDK